MAKLVINPDRKVSRINKEIYGHFSEHLGRCIYEGIYVGENSPIPNENGMRTDVVEALKKIQIPVLRWPGGCFADEYHWMDGIGPKESRKKMINTHWGGVIEDNSFGTHEYFELCRQLGCEAYVNGNLGSGTVQEMSEWVEYMTFDGLSPMSTMRKENGHEKPWEVRSFGVGNENWGCGGNMNPDYYANEYRRYQTYVRDYKHPDPSSGESSILKICSGPNVDDYEWTEDVLKTLYRHCDPRLHGHLDGLSLHYYVHPEGWQIKGSATDFDERVWYKTLAKAYFMDELVTKHSAIMDQYDPEKKVGLIVDEWGTWYTVEPGTNPGFLYQQNTIRDALVAGITLNIFNKHSDRVKMANIAQMINVLQSVILTEGADMILTPTYHVFDLYKVHQDADLVDSSIETEEIDLGDDRFGTGEGGRKITYHLPNLTESASVDADGILHITVTNASADAAYPVETSIVGHAVKSVTAETVSGEMHEKNTFEEPEVVTVKPFDGVAVTEQGLSFTIPPCAVVRLNVELQ
ncbi:MAG: alpha-N-arabinofuranosidase [Clostridiales bacterium]|nr:alpha-N-arabinofuranosidase [Clostridiales bacterium]